MRIIPLGKDELRVLRALVKGGRVERRRCYPFPPKYHLVRVDARTSAPIVENRTVADLLGRKLIKVAGSIDLSRHTGGDTLDYIATPAATRALQVRGIEVDEVQHDIFGAEPVRHRTGMDAAL